MRVQFGNPNIDVNKELEREIAAILKSGWVSIGEYVEALESRFREAFDVNHAIATSSATTGLIIAVKAAGWRNRVVHLPAFTWPSTMYASNCNGNGSICHDIDPDTWLLDPPTTKISENDCIIPVDIFGNQAPIHADFPKENRIYDAAHGYGLPDLGKRGIAEVVSLSFTKVVTAMEGGMILTDDGNLANIAVELRRLSGRMGEINALVALRSIDTYDYCANRVIISQYIKHITIPHKRQEIPTATNCSVFSVLFEEASVRNAIAVALAEKGIETKIYYDPLFDGLPVTKDIYRRILSLPIHTEVIPYQEEIIEIINTAGRRAKTPGKDFLTK